MSYSVAEARDDILTPFWETWASIGAPEDVVFTDKPATPPTSAPVWARVIIRHDDGFQSSLTGPLEGKKRWTNTGTIFMQVFCPIGDGSTKAYEVADLLLNTYRTQRHPNVFYRRVRLNEIGARGAFEQINVLANFQYDIVR